MKVSRLAKRRSESHDAIVAGRVAHADGRPIKPGYDVKEGDEIVVRYARKTLIVRILHVPERVTPATRATTLYDVVSETREEPLADLFDELPPL